MLPVKYEPMSDNPVKPDVFTKAQKILTWIAWGANLSMLVLYAIRNFPDIPKDETQAGASQNEAKDN